MSAAAPVATTNDAAAHVVHVTVPLTGANAAIVEASMVSIMHALEATRARIMDGGADCLRVRFCVTLGEGNVASVVQHATARRARPAPTAARMHTLDEASWWLTYVHTQLLRVVRECDGGPGQLEDTNGSTELVTHAVKSLVKAQCAAIGEAVARLRDHVLYTRSYLCTDEAAVEAQRVVDAAPTRAEDQPPPHRVATISTAVHRGVTWTRNPVSRDLLDAHGKLQLGPNAWWAFVPEALHTAAHFAHAASKRDMPMPTLTRPMQAALAAGAVDAATTHDISRMMSGYDMLLVQLAAPWSATEVPLRNTSEVHAFGQCVAQYMTRMLRHPHASYNTADSAVTAARVWAARDAARLDLLPEGVAPPRVTHWHVVPIDAPWSPPAARGFARVLNTAASSVGYPAGTAPVHAVFFPTAPPADHALVRALKAHAPLVVQDTPPLVYDDGDDADDDEDGKAERLESKAADADEPTPVEVALCSVAAIPAPAAVAARGMSAR
uniref:Uncharacterized protein n=1 Tax=viral metagenome TaxID=1070528 RepID=A0A6C0AU00_9ZZZZ